MKIGIFGGAGQVGYHLVRYFNAIPGMQAVALCRSSVVSAGLRHCGLPVRIYDSRSADSIREALQDCAAVIDSTFAPMQSLRRTDALSLFYRSVMESPGIQHMVHFSSVAVYGELSGGVSNFERPQPDTLYGAQKLTAEQVVRRAGKQADKPTLIARLGHVYGAEMAWSLDFVQRLKNNRVPFEHFGKTSNAIHVSQICSAVRAVINQQEEGCRDFAGSPNLSWGEIFDWHRYALSEGQDINFETPRRYHSSRKRCPRGHVAFWGEVAGNLKANLRSGFSSSPRISHAVKRFLASFPGAPSIQSVRSTVGSPGLELFFENTVSAESDLVFDSLKLSGPTCSDAGPVTPEDFRALQLWLRSISNPAAVLEYLEKVLAPALEPDPFDASASTRELWEMQTQG